MGIMVSASCVVSAAASSGRGVLQLLQCGVPPMGDSPTQTTPAQVPPMSYSSSQTAPVWATLPQGAVLQEQAAPAGISHRVTSPSLNS